MFPGSHWQICFPGILVQLERGPQTVELKHSSISNQGAISGRKKHILTNRTQLQPKSIQKYKRIIMLCVTDDGCVDITGIFSRWGCELLLESFLQTLAWWSCSRPKLIPHLTITLKTCWDVLTIILTAGIFKTLVSVCEERRGQSFLGSEHYKKSVSNSVILKRNTALFLLYVCFGLCQIVRTKTNSPKDIWPTLLY